MPHKMGYYPKGPSAGRNTYTAKFTVANTGLGQLSERRKRHLSQIGGMKATHSNFQSTWKHQATHQKYQ